MLFKKFIFFCVAISSFSIYSSTRGNQDMSTDRSAKRCVHENPNQPMFEYAVRGTSVFYSYKEVKKYMSSRYWIIGIGTTAVLCLGLAWCGLIDLPEAFAGALLISLLGCYEMRRFQRPAAAWLQALKEKEALASVEES